MLVLVVKEEVDILTKITHRIKTCIQSVHPRVKIQHRNLNDSSDTRFTNKCHKVIFLLSNKPDSKSPANKGWIGNLPNIRNKTSKFMIIRLNKFHETHTPLEDIEEQLPNNQNEIRVLDLEKDIFQWWPKVLIFLFGQRGVGGWFQKNIEPSWHKFCVHSVPNREETAHPMTREILNMLQTFGALRVDHHAEKQCCIVVCKEASAHLTPSLQSELKNTDKNVRVFGIALSQTNFSHDMVTHTDRCFTKQNLMSLILVLLTELNLINAKTNYQSVGRQNSGLVVPPLLLLLVAFLVSMFNMPAFLIQLVTVLIFPWPLMMFSQRGSENRVKFINYGFVASSVAIITILIVTETTLYPDYFAYPISVPVAIYLLIWQIGCGIKLYKQHDFKYGIYSIPAQILAGQDLNNCGM